MFCEGDEIQACDIHFTQRSDPSAWIEEVENQNFQPQSLELMEREYIARTLKWTDWNKREAARILGINRSTLDRKLERYEITQLNSKFG